MRKITYGACLLLAASCALLSACGDSSSSGDDTKYNAFTDERDGNVYRVVTIGDQVWMAENLRYDPLDSLVSGKYWCASKSKGNCENGYLYNFFAVMNDTACQRNNCGVVYPHQGICPKGFHVPENYEWKALAEKAFLTDASLGIASEFNAEPTGEFDYLLGEFNRDDIARYWTSSLRTDGSAYEWYVVLGEDSLQSQIFSPDYGYALRCVASVGEVKLDQFVEFEVPEPVTPVARSSSSRKTYSSSSENGSGIKESYVLEGGLNAFTDKRDGNVYRVLSVGPQVWMVENLRYNDTIASPVLKGRSWCIGSGDDCGKNGYLYDFVAVMANPDCEHSFCEVSNPHRGICPEGWHVPTDDEWDILLDVADLLGLSFNSIAGIPSSPTGEHSSYTKMDECARYWTASQANSEAAYEYYRCRQETSFRSQSYSKTFGYALRCVADPGEVKLDKYLIPENPSSSSGVFSSSSVESSSSAESSSSEVSSSSVSSSSETPAESSSSEGYAPQDDLETFTDARDGEVYTQVAIGSQIWMAENLRYADSTETPVLKGNTACIREDKCEDGNLYTYAAAVGNSECAMEVCFESYGAVRGICPEGWRLPSVNDWDKLNTSIILDHDALDMLRMIRTGERNDVGAVKYDSYARFWLVDEKSAASAYEAYYGIGDSYPNMQTYSKSFGYAVRCVKDVEVMDD